MNLPALAEWVRTPTHAAGVLAVLAAVSALAIRGARRAARKAPVAVVVAALGAMLCTAYSGDTSWGFARDHLAMRGTGERAVMFAAGELALFAVALMARQNLNTDGAPGTPGVLVWVITGVQVIPAYSESGIVAGTVRAFVGPVLAALLWHLAMGIELRHSKPGAASQGLLAVLAREARERLLSYLGLSVRGRDAAQITRDRWTGIATRRAAHLADLEAASAKPWRLSRARRRLAVAVDRTDAGVLEAQRAVLLDRLAAYRGAGQLASMTLTAPWEHQPEPAPVETVIERVPEPEQPPEHAYPEIAPPVPETVSATEVDTTFEEYVAKARALGAFPADEPRTRTEVQSEYPPKDPVHALRDRIGDDRFRTLWPDPSEPDDDSPPPPGEDTLTATARRDFLANLMDRNVPSIRTLKDRYGIGQPRATRIQTELKAALS